jgi:hypothetical protein
MFNEEELAKEINKRGKLDRGTVLTVLKQHEGESRADCVVALDHFLGLLDDRVVYFRGDRGEGVARLLKDLDSYGVKWT